MIDSIIYTLTFLVSSTIDVLLWGWGWFLVAPILLLNWVHPTVAVASLNFAALWIVVWSLYKLKKTWNFHFNKKYLLYIVFAIIWALYWVRLATYLDQNIIKNIILFSISILFLFWIIPYKAMFTIKIPKLIHWLLFILLFILSWAYIAIIWAWWWIVFSMLYASCTWLSLKKIAWYRMITVWLIIACSSVLYFLNGKLNFEIVSIWIIASTIGWYIWAHLIHKINEKTLKIIFSIAVVWTIFLVAIK